MVRRIIGRAETKQKDSVFGKYDGVWGKGAPVPGSRRPPPTFNWEAEKGAWEFEIQHHGELRYILRCSHVVLRRFIRALGQRLLQWR